MKYSDVAAYLTEGLTDMGYDPATADFPLLNPGPAAANRQQDLAPGRIVFVAVGGGSGLTTEGLYDRVFVTVRTVGRQMDYDDAETLAQQVDRLLLRIASSTTVGTARVLYFNRSGGSPSLLMQDEADRYHFQCSYLAEVASGL